MGDRPHFDAPQHETRVRFEATAALPDGWRLSAQWLDDNGEMDVLFTNAPPHTSPFASPWERRFVKFRKVTERRPVGEWERTDG